MWYKLMHVLLSALPATLSQVHILAGTHLLEHCTWSDRFDFSVQLLSQLIMKDIG